MSETQIHKTALVDSKAKLGKNVSVGPYSIINGNVTLGDDCQVGSHCVLTGRTMIGKHCQFFTGAVIGSIPQDKKYNDHEKVFLIIGDHNVFREYTTVNPGTGDGGKTTIGHNNLFMAYAHIAHDCVVGNNCVIANNGTLAGHVTLEDRAVVGGLSAVHQFVRLGELSIVGGCSKVVQDIPPFSMCDGHPAKVFNINSVGLKRAKFSPHTINSLRKAFRILFHCGLTRPHAIERIEKELAPSLRLKHLIEFAKTSKRGLCG